VAWELATSVERLVAQLVRESVLRMAPTLVAYRSDAIQFDRRQQFLIAQLVVVRGYEVYSPNTKYLASDKNRSTPVVARTQHVDALRDNDKHPETLESRHTASRLLFLERWSIPTKPKMREAR